MRPRGAARRHRPAGLAQRTSLRPSKKIEAPSHLAVCCGAMPAISTRPPRQVAAPTRDQRTDPSKVPPAVAAPRRARRQQAAVRLPLRLMRAGSIAASAAKAGWALRAGAAGGRRLRRGSRGRRSAPHAGRGGAAGPVPAAPRGLGGALAGGHCIRRGNGGSAFILAAFRRASACRWDSRRLVGVCARRARPVGAGRRLGRRADRGGRAACAWGLFRSAVGRAVADGAGGGRASLRNVRWPRSTLALAGGGGWGCRAVAGGRSGRGVAGGEAGAGGGAGAGAGTDRIVVARAGHRLALPQHRDQHADQHGREGGVPRHARARPPPMPNSRCHHGRSGRLRTGGRDGAHRLMRWSRIAWRRPPEVAAAGRGPAPAGAHACSALARGRPPLSSRRRAQCSLMRRALQHRPGSAPCSRAASWSP